MSFYKSIVFIISLVGLILFGCSDTAFYEQYVEIPGKTWNKDFLVEFSFEIEDTNSHYDILGLVRHTNYYRYRNLNVRMVADFPDTSFTNRLPLPLTSEDGTEWAGKCSGDNCDVSILLLPNAKFLKRGIYKLTFEQFMREKDIPVLENLKDIIAIGLRIEKVKQ